MLKSATFTSGLPMIVLDNQFGGIGNLSAISVLFYHVQSVHSAQAMG